MPTLTNGTNLCECTACGAFFGGVTTFDQHQVFMDRDENGRYIEDWERRRCLTPAEMEAKGWNLNERGFWGQPWHGSKEETEAA